MRIARSLQKQRECNPFAPAGLSGFGGKPRSGGRSGRCSARWRRRSDSTTARNTPRRSRRSPTTLTCCSSSTRIRPSTGCIYVPRIRSLSTFATVRLRTKVTKGPGSRGAGIAIAYKLIDAAQTSWRAVNAPHMVALVRAGGTFHKGKLLERPIDITPDTANADPSTAGSEVA
jgi:hypothetical protein